VRWERFTTSFCTSNITWRFRLYKNIGCDLTDVLATRRFALLVKSL